MRRTVRAVTRDCVFCRKLFARAVQQKMGQLPKERVTLSPPFTTTGLDFAGPFYTKRGAVRKPILVKTYITLFICFITRAVHMEALTDMSGEAFLAALRWFVSRRGYQESFRQIMGPISFPLIQTSKHCTRPWTNRSLSNRYPVIHITHPTKFPGTTVILRIRLLMTLYCRHPLAPGWFSHWTDQ